MKGNDMHSTDAARSSRRNFVIGTAAAGVAALFPSLRSSAQNNANARRIDVHHHFEPDVYVAYRRAHNQGGPNAAWNVNKAIDEMGRAGVETSICSITQPAFSVGTVEEVRKAIRGTNEAAAKYRADYPGRFGSFAAIPMIDIDGSLKEMEYALDTLKADGIGLLTSYQDNKWLGDPSFDPIWQEANRRRAVVYTHPTEPWCCQGLLKGVNPNIVEFGTDTTRTIASLIFYGTTSRFPDIKFIMSHAGGTAPYVAERFINGTAAEFVPGVVTKGQGGSGVVGSNPPKNVPKGVLYELQKMYYDTAQASNPIAMGALRKLVPMSQIVFGTDYWFRGIEETVKNLDTCGVFNAEELRAINRGNVERIIPKYKT
jgi:predicted TIM-barrel fold metal-dependent hydrolase